MQIKWLRQALQNLEDEAEYIASDDAQAATRIVQSIEEATALLKDNPGLGRAGRVPGTRELVVSNTPYIVPYRVRDQSVEILRVFHARRRWPSQL